MKKRIIRTLTALFLILFLSAAPALIAQEPPPPPGGHGLEGNQAPPGGGAPIGSGIVILFALGAAYGGNKVYKMNKRNLAD